MTIETTPAETEALVDAIRAAKISMLACLHWAEADEASYDETAHRSAHRDLHDAQSLVCDIAFGVMVAQPVRLLDRCPTARRAYDAHVESYRAQLDNLGSCPRGVISPTS